MANTYNDVLHTTTKDYLNQIKKIHPRPPAPQIEEQLLAAINLRIELENANLPKGQKWKPLKTLAPSQHALILSELYGVRRIQTGGVGSNKDYELLAIYQEDGPDAGTYSTDESEFRAIMQKYDFTMDSRKAKEAMEQLRLLAPRVKRCSDGDLIAVNNGIFNYATKKLFPFDPGYVFLSKSRVDYNPNATNVVIHNDDDGTDWDVESWMEGLSDDPEIVNLLWQILGAIIRPFVSWNKSAWFYSESGNNGKGTLCELMRQLCGDGTYASIPLADLGRDFMLESLIRASALIVDENSVGEFIDKTANLKAIVTNDVILINRKHKMPVPYQFFGFMVQCLNEMPRVRDRSDSFFRRQLFVPFEKCFTGAERKYIKDDYLHRKEVLEYVLKRVLHMNYYELSEPEACRLALNEYREYNDPVRQFAEDVLPVARWDLLPFKFLYDMYKEWYKRNVPSGKIESRNAFINDIVAAVNSYSDEWECQDKTKQIRACDRMSATEPLITEYNLEEWMNPKFRNLAAMSDTDKATPMTGQFSNNRYRGITRKPSVVTAVNSANSHPAA